MEATPYLLLVVLHISVLSEGNNSPSPCSLSREIGPCRFVEPCMPKLSSWNESFIIVSWEGLFEGCHEGQINQMYVKTEEAKEVGFKKITFSKNEIYLEKKFCKSSNISLIIGFNEDHVNFQAQQRDLHTHKNNCSNIMSAKNNDDIILGSSISAGILIVIILIILVVIALKKRCWERAAKRNVDNDMDVDMNPVYGDYYYKDGGRRQNVVEVAKLIFF